MFQTLKNAWKIPELRKKILFTLLIVLLYRLGACLPVPYVNPEVYTTGLQSQGIFELLNIMSGGAFGKATLFALSVSPYITASIVMQLLTIAIPKLEKLAQSGEEGKKKITSYTRWVTVALALLTAVGYTYYLNSTRISQFSTETMLISRQGFWEVFKWIVVIVCYCAGAALIMWLAERINEHGIGNGISIILFANILSRGGSICGTLYNLFVVGKQGGQLVLGIFWLVLVAVAAVAFFGFIVWFTNSERRIPVQYAKRVVGRKMYGGQTSNLPLKLNMTGVMPIIFTSSIVSIPATIGEFLGADNGFTKFIQSWFNYNTWPYVIVSFGLIIAFSYFYVLISFNPIEVANNIRNNGGSIPGIRPGKPTTDYITRILNRITLIGALFVGLISCLPMIVNIIAGGMLSSIAFIGSSLMIVVGVALETYRDIEAQITMRNYKGFLD